MTIIKTARMFGAATILVSASALTAMAQTTEPTAPTPPTAVPPAATMPAPTSPSAAPRSATAPAEKTGMVGLAAFSSDGSRVGTVDSVMTDGSGKITAIHLKTGGFLGFGGRLVSIPEGKFTRSGENVQLGMSSDEVSKLPALKEQS